MSDHPYGGGDRGTEGRRPGGIPRSAAPVVAGDEEVTPLDLLFQRVCSGDERAFESWMVQVEEPVRRVLGPWVRAVDVECVVQETFVRMWIYAPDRGHELSGRNASLRFATGMARNLARNEARRLRRRSGVVDGGLPEVAVEPRPLSDPALERIIRYCLDRLPGSPRAALLARLEQGFRDDDRSLAEGLGMKLNTFLQNVVRGRRHLERCLEENGAPLAEILP